MAQIFQITLEDGATVGPDFTTWEEARDYRSEHQIPGSILSRIVEPDSFPSNPEPQEMTSAWVREMDKHQ